MVYLHELRDMEDLLTIVGQNVRYYRHQSGLSQEKLAEDAELHRNYVGGLERGEYNVSLRSLARIASALQVEPFVLLIQRSDTRSFIALAEHTSGTGEDA